MNKQPELHALSHQTNVVEAAKHGVAKRMLRTHCDTGYKMDNGERIQLRAVLLRGQYMTCPEWVREFYTAVAAVRQKPANRSSVV